MCGADQLTCASCSYVWLLVGSLYAKLLTQDSVLAEASNRVEAHGATKLRELILCKLAAS